MELVIEEFCEPTTIISSRLFVHKEFKRSFIGKEWRWSPINEIKKKVKM